MRAADVKALKTEHKLASVSDRAHCSCGWVSKTRVALKSAAKSLHNDHVAQVLAEAEKAELTAALTKVGDLVGVGRATVRVDAELHDALALVVEAAREALG